MSLIESVTLLAGQNPIVTLLILAVASVTEYVFPPFPGDTITVAGAVLVVTSGLSLPWTFIAILAGSLLGAAIDFHVGVLLARGRGRDLPPTGLRGRIARSSLARQAFDGADRAARTFARWGEWAIVLNRFLPGIRAFLFVAAGMGGMRFGRVMLFAAVSSVIWNAFLVAAGIALGANIERIEGLMRAWGRGAWLLLGLAAAIWLVRSVIVRRRRQRRDG